MTKTEKPPNTPGPLVWVRWIDSFMDGGWRRHRAYETPDTFTCETVGWLVREEKGVICLAQSIALAGTPDYQHCQRLWIPRQAILEQREIVD